MSFCQPVLLSPLVYVLLSLIAISLFQGYGLICSDDTMLTENLQENNQLGKLETKSIMNEKINNLELLTQLLIML